MKYTDASNDQLESALAGIRNTEKKNKNSGLFAIEERRPVRQSVMIFTPGVSGQKMKEPDTNVKGPDTVIKESEYDVREDINLASQEDPKVAIEMSQDVYGQDNFYQNHDYQDDRKVVIQVRDLYKIFRVGSNKVRALNGVNFDVYEGEFCAIVGTSGSGKSTLLNMLAGLERPSKGTVVIAGHHIETMKENQLVKFRRENVGFIFQSFNLIGTMNALENVALPLAFRGIPKMLRLKRAMKLLNLVGLKDHANHRPNQMSGGQQQRVGMARALVVNPKIMFADEPTGNLDSRTSKSMMNLMRDIVNKQKKTLIMVTHDDSLAAIADKVIRIVDGKIVSIEDRYTKRVEELK